MKVGRVKISRGFLLLCAWLLYQDDSGIVIQGLLACLLHEAGHCGTLYYFQNIVKEISITSFGAQIVPGSSLSYGQEFMVAAAGPGINLLLAYLFCTFPMGQAFAGINLVLALFNLLPISEMDGARMLRCVLSILLSEDKAFSVSRCLSFCFTAIFLTFGILFAVPGRNLTLFVMVFWLMKRSLLEKTSDFGEKDWK